MSTTDLLPSFLKVTSLLAMVFQPRKPKVTLLWSPTPALERSCRSASAPLLQPTPFFHCSPNWLFFPHASPIAPAFAYGHNRPLMPLFHIVTRNCSPQKACGSPDVPQALNCLSVCFYFSAYPQGISPIPPQYLTMFSIFLLYPLF